MQSERTLEIFSWDSSTVHINSKDKNTCWCLWLIRHRGWHGTNPRDIWEMSLDTHTNVHKQIQTSLHSRTMGCVTATSCWLPIMALLVLLLRPWPFLKGALGPGGISLQGDVGEVDRTRVFRAATSACRTSIWTQEKEKVFSDNKLKRGLSSGIYKISHLTKTCFAFKNVKCRVMEWKKHFLLTQAPCF